MRLWHYELLPYLPNSQLIAQWRELNSIFKKQDEHILINYIYEYADSELMGYTELVLNEVRRRGFKVNLSADSNYRIWLFERMGIKPSQGYAVVLRQKYFVKHHTDRYLLQCFYNLQEKYDRGQKDFSLEIYNKLENFIFQKLGDNRLIG